MNVDLTPEELRYLSKLVDAGDKSDPANLSLYSKINRCLENFPEGEPDPAAASKKWQTPGKV